MKVQETKQVGEKKSHTPAVGQPLKAATRGKSPVGRQPSFDDLHARITVRAYELYVERGYRDGNALEDWLDAEREVLAGMP
jgi:hypothetical protein